MVIIDFERMFVGRMVIWNGKNPISYNFFFQKFVDGCAHSLNK